MSWYAVRHVIANGRNYEERITLWDAKSADEAITRAREEAVQYAQLDKDWYALDLFQAYRMSDQPSDGGEVFSLIREADLEPDEYLSGFFDTGKELQQRV